MEAGPKNLELARVLLQGWAGLDIANPSQKDTPRRFLKMLKELTTPEEFEFTTFDAGKHQQQIIAMKDIPFVSLCEHHVVPFVGVAHVGYIPNAAMAGLSKLARCVRETAKGLRTQEYLTDMVADLFVHHLDPAGVIVMMEAEHLCMTIRGVQTPGTRTITSAVRGLFFDPPTGKDPKGEFLSMIGKR
jgi:GTP cyclohydrolase IA